MNQIHTYEEPTAQFDLNFQYEYIPQVNIFHRTGLNIFT